MIWLKQPLPESPATRLVLICIGLMVALIIFALTTTAKHFFGGPHPVLRVPVAVAAPLPPDAVALKVAALVINHPEEWSAISYGITDSDRNIRIFSNEDILNEDGTIPDREPESSDFALYINEVEISGYKPPKCLLCDKRPSTPDQKALYQAVLNWQNVMVAKATAAQLKEQSKAISGFMKAGT